MYDVTVESRDLETGTLHDAWYGLTYDLSTVSAPIGTYPSFAFTPSDDGIIIWADGKIYIVYLTANSRGEKVAAGDPAMIGFTAHIEKRLAETLADEKKRRDNEKAKRVAAKQKKIDDLTNASDKLNAQAAKLKAELTEE